MKTYQPKKGEIERNWHLIDIKDQILGRTATKIARLLIGKHKVGFSSHMDVGDNVVVINAAKLKVTGNKMKKKIYYRHSGYMGNLKEARLEELMDKDPRQVVLLAVKNMLPKNKLRALRLKRLKIFVDEKHPHEDKLKVEKKKNGKN